MSNLILSFISIALIAATAAATVFFGGDAVRGGTAQAGAATLQNIGSQVSGYASMHWASTGENYADITLSDLTGPGSFMQTDQFSPPGGGTVTLTNGEVTISNIDDDVCKAVLSNAGIEGTDEDDYIIPAQDGVEDLVFGCYADTDGNTFFHK